MRAGRSGSQRWRGLMTPLDGLAALVVLVVIYLFYAVINPEKF